MIYLESYGTRLSLYQNCLCFVDVLHAALFQVEFHSKAVDSFLKEQGLEYRAIKTIDSKATVKDAKARTLAM